MAKFDVGAETTGSVWKILVAVGERVVSQQPLFILESMKMEIPVESPCEGNVLSILVSEGDPVNEGQVLATVESA